MGYEYIERNLSEVREKIDAACKKVGREEPVTMLAAVKYAEPAEIEYLYRELGVKTVGENRVQQMLEHMESIDCEGLEFHFIGTLQTNKVKYIIDKAAIIHSVDSLRLAETINAEAAKKNVIANILIEVNVAQEESKFGLSVDEVLPLIEQISATCSNIRIRGLMTIAPFVEDPEENRSVFRDLQKLSVDIDGKNINNVSVDILSMGMSNDFEVAVEEGATHVRVGTSIFGQRNYNIEG